MRNHPSSPWPSFFLVATGVFLATMDSSMINVALPSMMRSLHTTLAQIEWVAISYLLTITSTLLLWGRLSDRLGKVPTYLLGMLVFTLGSATCFCANSLLLLVLCRCLQATGASMMMASGPAIITAIFPAHQLGRSLGILGIATSIGLMSGPVVSGFLLRFFSWRAIFLVTVPISLSCCAGGWLVMRTNRTTSSPPASCRDSSSSFGMDWPGLILWTLLITTTVLAATHYRTLPSGGVAIAASIFCLALFLFIRTERRAAAPLLPLVLFQSRPYTIGIICAALSFAILFMALILTPFYLDFILQVPVQRIGLIMMATPVAVFLVAPLSGHLYDHIGGRFLTTGGLLLCGLALLSFSFLAQNSNELSVVSRLALLGAGQALFLSPNSASLLSSARPGQLGITSASLATARNLGMLAGITLAGLLFGGLFSVLTGGLDLKDFTPAQTEAFIQALHITFGLTAIMALAGVRLSWSRD